MKTETGDDGNDMDPHDLTFIAKMTFSVNIDGSDLYMTADPSYEPFGLGLAGSSSPNAIFAAYHTVDGACMLQQMNPALQQAHGDVLLFVGFVPTGHYGNQFILPLLNGMFSPLIPERFEPHQFAANGLSNTSTSVVLWDNDLAGVQVIDGNPYNLGIVGVGEGQFMLYPGPAEQPKWKVQVLTPGWPAMDSANFNYTLLHKYMSYGASLKNAEFINADLSESMILGCDLTGAVFTGADLSGSQWGDEHAPPSTMNGATFLNTNLAGATFTNCAMAGADLTGAAFSPATSFAGADLSNAKFSQGANLRGVNFTDAILTGAALVGADLTGAKFSQKVVAQGTDLSKSILSGNDVSGVDFSGAKLTGANLTSATLRDANLNGADLTGVIAQNADFTSTSTPGTQLAGTNFTGVDLTTASFDSFPHFSTDSANLTIFNGATLNYKVLTTQWSYLNLTGATIVDLPTDISSAAQPLIAHYAVIASLKSSRGGGLSETILQAADFSNAAIGVVDLNRSDLTGAKLDQASFSGTNLDGAILENISALGTQFGGLDPLFDLNLSAQSALNSGGVSDLVPWFEPHGISLSADSTVSKTRALWKVTDSINQQNYTVTKDTSMESGSPVITIYGASLCVVDLTSYPKCEADLDTGPNADLIVIFAHYNLSLALTATITLETASWSINDEEHSLSYLVRKDTAATLGVYVSSASISAAYAHLSNAILTSAGLYGAAASSSDFYGESTNLQDAILEDANLDNANLSECNLQHAQMQGASLDNAALVNANLQGALLTRGASGKVASLSHAYLQGADFTDALLYGADLSNAAVGVSMGSGTDAGTGVYLFSLAASNKQSLDQAAKQFRLNPDGDLAQFSLFIKALNDQNVAVLQPIFNAHELELSAAAKIAPASSEGKREVWQVVQDGDVSYTLWSALTPPSLEVYGTGGGFSLNPTADPTVFSTLVGALNNQDLPPLQTAFSTLDHPIADSSEIDTGAQTGEWVLASDSSVYYISSLQDGKEQNELYVLPQFSLNPTGDQDLYARLVAALDSNDISTLRSAFVAQNYALADGTAIQSGGVQWQITDQGTSYAVWVRMDDSGNPILHAGPNNDDLTTAFLNQGYLLQPLATTERGDESGWFVDNDSDNPDSKQSGYIRLQILDLSPNPLDVYGTTIRMERTLANGTKEFTDAECQATNLSPANMGQDTVCPNEQTFQANQDGTTKWNDWMRAARWSSDQATKSPHTSARKGGLRHWR